MVSRVATYMSSQVMVGRMNDIQTRIYETQIQVATEKKSQTYMGISTDAMRLVNFENQHDQMERYRQNNSLAEIRLNSMSSALSGTQDTLRSFREELIQLSQQTIDVNDEQELEDIQTRAFSTMQNMQYFLNTEVAGRYVFSGGKTGTPPVSFPYGNLAEYQQRFDGNSVVSPGTQAANLFDATFANKTVTATGTGLSAAPGDFITQSLDDNNFGTLTMAAPTSSTADWTITSDQAGAFSPLTIGSTLLFDAGTGGSANVGDYEQAFTIVEISADGKQIKVQPPAGTPAPTNPTETIAAGSAAQLHVAIPDGTTVDITNGTDTSTFTVNWPAGATLDGSQIYLEPAADAAAFNGQQVTVSSTSYYRGDNLTVEHRVDESRSIEIGINARDPAFEKAFRALGMLAQGKPLDSTTGLMDVDAMAQRIDDALTLMNDVFEHQPGVREDVSDLATLERSVANSQILIKNTKITQRDSMAYLEARMSDMENVNMMEAATRLNDDANALEISYSVLARVKQLSLGNYI